MLEQKFKELDKLVNSLDETNVVCCGLYNNGKSTLLNVLIDDFEFKTFKTADIRETTASKKQKYKNITYIDTPGLNATYEDDKVVIDTIIESDINLFVHNITTGELNEKEVEFLNILKENWDKREFINKTIFVLSRIDELENIDDIQNTKNRVNTQIKDIFGTNPTIIEVSAIDYKDGKVEDENQLIKTSGIDNLKDYISKFIKEDIKSLKKLRIADKQKEIETKINNLLNKTEKEITKIEKSIKEHNKKLSHKIDEYSNNLISKYNQI